MSGVHRLPGGLGSDGSLRIATPGFVRGCLRGGAGWHRAGRIALAGLGRAGRVALVRRVPAGWSPAVLASPCVRWSRLDVQVPCASTTCTGGRGLAAAACVRPSVRVPPRPVRSAGGSGVFAGRGFPLPRNDCCGRGCVRSRAVRSGMLLSRSPGQAHVVVPGVGSADEHAVGAGDRGVPEGCCQADLPGEAAGVPFCHGFGSAQFAEDGADQFCAEAVGSGLRSEVRGVQRPRWTAAAIRAVASSSERRKRQASTTARAADTTG